MTPYSYNLNQNMLPQGLPQGSTYDIDFGLNNPQIISLSQLFDEGTIKNVQSVWADNSQNGFGLSITVNSTGQNIVVPPNYQGVVPLIITSNLTGEITVSSPSSVAQIVLILMDVPLDYFLYNTTTVAETTQNVEVVNPITTPVNSYITNTSIAPIPVDLPANTSTVPLYVDVMNATTSPIPISYTNTIPFLQSNNSTLYNLPEPLAFSGNTMSAVLTTATLAATPVNISVEVAGYYVFPTSITFIISSDTTIGVAGIETISIGWNNAGTFTEVANFGVYLTTTGGATLSDKVITIPVNFLNASVDNLTIAVEIGTVLTGGQISVICNYGYFTVV